MTTHAPSQTVSKGVRSGGIMWGQITRYGIGLGGEAGGDAG